MKSIRRSLILYFLVLLALALGAASLYSYQSARRNLLEKKATILDLLRTRHQDRSEEVRAKLDKELLAQAWTLANLAQYQFQWGRGRHQALYPLGLLTAGTSPNGSLLAPVWLAGGTRGSAFGERVLLMCVTEIQFNEDVLLQAGEGQGTEYFQINTAWGNLWRSRSMGKRSFPVNAKVFAATTPLFESKADDPILAPGIAVRRVTLKVPVASVRYFWSPSPARPNGPTASRPDFTGRGAPPRAHGPERVGPPSRPETPGHGGPGDGFVRPTPAFVIQCAGETTQRDAVLADLQGGLDNDLADLEDQSRSTLASLRDRLLLIGLATFAATLVGGCWLVRVGLAPLRKLSVAVSEVSEKDFHLSFDARRLPSELAPIVDRLSQTLESLKRAFAREKQAAADISHELRTPLAALLTTTEVALRKPRSPEEYRELLEDCHTSGQQMHQLVERLLALARLDAGVDTLRPQEVDVADLAEQCASLVRPLAEARDLDLRLHCKSPAYLTADPNKLREVLTNLLHNAIEYNRPRGTVDLSVERANGHVKMEVRDTGIGIPSEAREHIFERFYRADPSRQADGLHAGLGLAIVKGYVDLMGGTIEVQSTEGEGTRFRVQLPA